MRARSIDPAARWLAVLLLSSVPLVPLPADEALVSTAPDGWQTWRVDANTDVGEWCCYNWQGGVMRQIPCNLDHSDSDINYVSSTQHTTGQIQIYALMKAGKPTRLQAVSPHCKVRTRSTVNDLGMQATDASLLWLEALVTPRNRLSRDAIAAISAHAGDRPVASLRRIATSDSNAHNREEALFWIVQSAPDAAVPLIEDILFD